MKADSYLLAQQTFKDIRIFLAFSFSKLTSICTQHSGQWHTVTDIGVQPLVHKNSVLLVLSVLYFLGSGFTFLVDPGWLPSLVLISILSMSFLVSQGLCPRTPPFPSLC